MPRESEGRDLVLLVADGNTEHTVKGLLSRPEAPGIRAVKFEVIKHVERDPGCLKSTDLLRLYRDRYLHADELPAMRRPVVSPAARDPSRLVPSGRLKRFIRPGGQVEYPPPEDLRSFRLNASAAAAPGQAVRIAGRLVEVEAAQCRAVDRAEGVEVAGSSGVHRGP